MKKLCILLVFMGILVVSNPAIAADDPVRKLAGGVGEVVAAPFEILKGLAHETYEHDNKVIGISLGGIKGLVQTMHRTLTGVVDIATFPYLPENY